LLYHNALSTDVVVSNILRYARKSQESGGTTAPNEDLVEQISELRKLVQKQEQMIESLGSGNASAPSTTLKQNPSTDAIASLITAPSSEKMNIETQPGMYSVMGGGGGGGRTVARTMSASNLDVWGEMALGDSAVSQGGYQSAQSYQPTTVPRTSDFEFSSPSAMPPR